MPKNNGAERRAIRRAIAKTNQEMHTQILHLLCGLRHREGRCHTEESYR